MDNEFTKARVVKFLSNYVKRLDELAERRTDFVRAKFEEKVVAVISELQYELDLAQKNKSDILLDSCYIPALEEALRFLDHVDVADSVSEFDAWLYDASISLRYYLHH